MESVNIAVVRTGAWTGRVGRTGIDKRPATGPVWFEPSGVQGDSVCDTNHHGTWYQAAYAYDVEDYQHWSVEIGHELVPGNAGENLSLVGCDCARAVIGERWRIGTAVLRVTCPRNPCRVFAGFWDVPGLVKRFTAFGRTGAYLAVEVAGEIRAGDTREVLSRPEHGVTAEELFAVRLRGQRELAPHVSQAFPHLPDEWRESVAAVL